MPNFDNNDLGMISLTVFGIICVIAGVVAVRGGVSITEITTFAMAIAGMISALANNKNKGKEE